MKSVESALRPSLELEAPTTVRAVVRDQKDRTIVHVYNLGIERLSSFEDKIHPVSDITLRIRVPFGEVRSVRAISADPEATAGSLQFTEDASSGELVVETKIPRLIISTIVLIEGPEGTSR